MVLHTERYRKLVLTALSKAPKPYTYFRPYYTGLNTGLTLILLVKSTGNLPVDHLQHTHVELNQVELSCFLWFTAYVRAVIYNF